ncbi:hypothetical protein [Methylobacterium nodulans]|nr:hypothetical protein [Methylobacterium nodulans]
MRHALIVAAAVLGVARGEADTLPPYGRPPHAARPGSGHLAAL